MLGLLYSEIFTPILDLVISSGIQTQWWFRTAMRFANLFNKKHSYLFQTSIYLQLITCIDFLPGIEIVGPDWRSFTGMMMQMFFMVGYLLVSILSYFIQDWHKLQLAFTAFSAPILLCFW